MDLPVFHLSFPVRDLELAVAFYRDTLGASVGRNNEQWADVLLFGHQLTLHQRPDQVLAPRQRGVRHFGVILPWQQWLALGARLGQSGQSFVNPPTVSLAGTDQEQGKMLLADPSDNLVEIKAYRDPAAVFGSGDREKD